MDGVELEKLLTAVASGALSTETARERLLRWPVSDLGYARIDHHREVRQGMPEVVFGEKKTVEQLVGIIGALAGARQNILVTRIDAAKAEQVMLAHPGLSYSPLGRTLSRIESPKPDPLGAPVALVTAGTSDQAVAEEAAETLRMAGASVNRYFDVGVAGIHRLLTVLPELERAPAIICVAGMEGALPSVLGGLVRAPVIAVPTSVGYGAALDGFTALFGMLTGCASGVSVVNIDNGFGAAMAALRIGWGFKLVAGGKGA